RPRLWTRCFISLYSGPMTALVWIHSGLRSIGTSALRASMRSMRRPSGAMVTLMPPSCRPFGKSIERGRAPVRSDRARGGAVRHQLLQAGLGDVDDVGDRDSV